MFLHILRVAKRIMHGHCANTVMIRFRASYGTCLLIVGVTGY